MGEMQIRNGDARQRP